MNDVDYQLLEQQKTKSSIDEGKFIILNLYDEYFPIIVTDEDNRPIIFNSYDAAKSYAVIIAYHQIVKIQIENSYESN